MADGSKAESFNEKTLQNFLDRPSQQSMLAVSKMDAATLTKKLTNDGPELGKLCDQICKGNPWAARYLLNILHKCDGASLESALNALGQFGDHHSEQLLDFVHEGMMTETDLTAAVETTPFDLVDNIAEQIHFLEVRQKKFEQVNRKELLILRSVVIKAVNESVAMRTSSHS